MTAEVRLHIATQRDRIVREMLFSPRLRVSFCSTCGRSYDSRAVTRVTRCGSCRKKAL